MHLFVDLLAVLGVLLDQFDELRHLFLSSHFTGLNLLFLLVDGTDFLVFLRFLFLIILAKHLDTCSQVQIDSFVNFSLSLEYTLQTSDLLLELGLVFLVKTIFARLLALNLALQVLDVEVFLNLSLVLLTLKLSHLLGVLILLAREVVLQLLVVRSRLLDISSQ